MNKITIGNLWNQHDSPESLLGHEVIPRITPGVALSLVSSAAL
jgi:hypothetical protein